MDARGGSTVYGDEIVLGDLYVAGKLSGSIQARTAVTTYRDHNMNASLDAPIISRSNTEDNWIYCDAGNGQYGIYHRNIASTLVVSGQADLPTDTIAFIGGNLLSAYISLADGGSYFRGKMGIGASPDTNYYLSVGGNIKVLGNIINLGYGLSTENVSLEIGAARTGNGYSYLDFIGDTTYTDYGFRIIRGNAGANAYTELIHRGTGDFSLVANEAGSIRLKTAGSGRLHVSPTGQVGIGADANATFTLYVAGTSSIRTVGTIEVAYGVVTADACVRLGNGRTGNGSTYLDLIGDATYTTYGLRIIRYNSGANTSSSLQHRGTGELSLNAVDAGSIGLYTTNTRRVRINATGQVGIGVDPDTTHTLKVGGGVRFDGSLGIGADVDTAFKLKVGGDTRIAGLLQLDGLLSAKAQTRYSETILSSDYFGTSTVSLSGIAAVYSDTIKFTSLVNDTGSYAVAGKVEYGTDIGVAVASLSADGTTFGSWSDSGIRISNTITFAYDFFSAQAGDYRVQRILTLTPVGLLQERYRNISDGGWYSYQNNSTAAPKTGTSFKATDLGEYLALYTSAADTDKISFVYKPSMSTYYYGASASLGAEVFDIDVCRSYDSGSVHKCLIVCSVGSSRTIKFVELTESSPFPTGWTMGDVGVSGNVKSLVRVSADDFILYYSDSIGNIYSIIFNRISGFWKSPVLFRNKYSVSENIVNARVASDLSFNQAFIYYDKGSSVIKSVLRNTTAPVKLPTIVDENVGAGIVSMGDDGYGSYLEVSNSKLIRLPKFSIIKKASEYSVGLFDENPSPPCYQVFDTPGNATWVNPYPNDSFYRGLLVLALGGGGGGGDGDTSNAGNAGAAGAGALFFTDDYVSGFDFTVGDRGLYGGATTSGHPGGSTVIAGLTLSGGGGGARGGTAGAPSQGGTVSGSLSSPFTLISSSRGGNGGQSWQGSGTPEYGTNGGTIWAKDANGSGNTTGGLAVPFYFRGLLSALGFGLFLGAIGNAFPNGGDSCDCHGCGGAGGASQSNNGGSGGYGLVLVVNVGRFHIDRKSPVYRRAIPIARGGDVLLPAGWSFASGTVSARSPDGTWSTVSTAGGLFFSDGFSVRANGGSITQIA